MCRLLFIKPAILVLVFIHLPVPEVACANQLEPAPVAEISARFGKSERRELAGEMDCNAGKAMILLQWVEIGYSEYDVLQSDGYFANRAQVSALLSVKCLNETSARRINCVGSRVGKTITLRDARILELNGIGDAAFQQLIEKCKAFNQQHDVDPHPMHLVRVVAPDVDIQMYLLEDVPKQPGPEMVEPIQLHQLAANSAWTSELIAATSEWSWIGEMTATDGAVYNVRLQVLLPRLYRPLTTRSGSMQSECIHYRIRFGDWKAVFLRDRYGNLSTSLRACFKR